MRRTIVGLGLLGLAGLAGSAWGRHGELDPTPPAFGTVTPWHGGVAPAPPAPAYLASSRIAAVEEGALAIDADSGALIRTDAAATGIAQLAIGRDAGTLVYDDTAQLAYVADRRGDRIVVVRTGVGLEVVASWRTQREPYGVALTPDRATLVVATIADRTLSAYDVATGAERWRVAIDAEPRGLAISPDGARALVTHAASNALDDVSLTAHTVERIGVCCGVVRGAFAATFMGARQAVVPFQVSVPVGATGAGESTERYGGTTFRPPVTHHLAFVELGKAATTNGDALIAEHQPRALAWDGARDALYVAGLGNDRVVQLRRASQLGIALGMSTSVAGGRACGPDGLAVAPDGNLWVWCSFTRSVSRLAVLDKKGKLAAAAKLTAGPELVASSLSEAQHDGMIMFHQASVRISEHGAVACASCHLDGRADGLSWQIAGKQLQTPVLAGRLVGTAPFKWDGSSPGLRDSLADTLKRLGGGLTLPQADALIAYLEAMPAPRPPSRDPAAVARGKALFDSAGLGCRGCHDGPSYTDRQRHAFVGDLHESDTPSLIGLAASAPYFHDGSAATLEVLLHERAGVHGMAETTTLDPAQTADLVAFLESL